MIRKSVKKNFAEQPNVAKLKTAIYEGINSGISIDFDPEKHLKRLKSSRL